MPAPWIAAFRYAGKRALRVLFLSIPILAFRLRGEDAGALSVVSRWPLVAFLCGGIFLVSLCIKMLTAVSLKPPAIVAGSLGQIGAPLLLAGALLFPVLMGLITGDLGQARYWIDLGILVLTYVMLAWGLNIVVGLAGLLDLGYVAFYAVGAYCYALLSTEFGLSFWICLPLSGLLAAIWGIILGFPVLHLRGDYLAIVTLAFGEVIRIVLVNWTELTNGGAGIASIPRLTFFGTPFTDSPEGFATLLGLDFDPMHRNLFLYYLILALALMTSYVSISLRKLPVGWSWEALREDEIACQALGINTTSVKLTAFAVGATLAGFAGCFFSVRQGFVSPESFVFMESAVVLAIVVLGGMGSNLGIAIAAIILVGGPELLRNLGLLKDVFGVDFDPNEYRMLLFGLGMVVMMLVRPRGLAAARLPSVSFRQRKAVAAEFAREGQG